MKKFSILLASFLVMILAISCTAQSQFERERYEAKYTTQYAKSVNDLEKAEGNFKVYRRVIFYNVRLGETVFACEGYCHVQIDSDGDIELVINNDDDRYLRHYLGQKQDITYFSEQLRASDIPEKDRYRITFNPKLWIPQFNFTTASE